MKRNRGEEFYFAFSTERKICRSFFESTVYKEQILSINKEKGIKPFVGYCVSKQSRLFLLQRIKSKIGCTSAKLSKLAFALGRHYLCKNMKEQLEILKGIHPGLFLNRELRNRQLKNSAFAASIGVHPQTLSAIIKGRRNMNVPLSLKIERSLHLDEGFLMTLQVYYDIEQEKKKEAHLYHPDLSVYRKTLFWDTDFDQMDWNVNKRYIINRIFERGNEKEILETIRFYGKETIRSLLDSKNQYAVDLKSNIQTYLNDAD